MIDIATLLAYVISCAIVVIIPGPSVTLIIANSLHAGRKAGLWNVAGSQLSLAIILLILALGLETIVRTLGAALDIIRLLGAAYLIWMGISLLRSSKSFETREDTVSRSNNSYFWQGCTVMLANPKTLIFFGAFIPQFVNPTQPIVLQVFVFGAIFMIVAALLDSIYAILVDKAARWLTSGGIKVASSISGILLIGGGLWLALSRRS